MSEIIPILNKINHIFSLKEKIYRDTTESLKEWRNYVIKLNIVENKQKYIKIIQDGNCEYRALAALKFKKTDNNSTYKIKLEIIEYMLKTFFGIKNFTKELYDNFINYNDKYMMLDINETKIFDKDNIPKNWEEFWLNKMSIKKIIQYKENVSLDANVAYLIANFLTGIPINYVVDKYERYNNFYGSEIPVWGDNIVIPYIACKKYEKNICMNKVIINNELNFEKCNNVDKTLIGNFKDTMNLIFFQHNTKGHFDAIVDIKQKKQKEIKYDNVTLIIINDNILHYADEDTIFLDAAGTSFANNYNNAIWYGSGISGILRNYAIKENNIISETNLKNYMTIKDFENIKNREKAKYIKYQNCGIIHVISNDFSSGGVYNDDSITIELKKSYEQVYNEYIKNIKGATDFRMVTLSGALYSGMYKDKILNQTPNIIIEIFRKIDEPIKLYLYEFDDKSYEKLILLIK